MPNWASWRPMPMVLSPLTTSARSQGANAVGVEHGKVG
jgi:hypothetical protein